MPSETQALLDNYLNWLRDRTQFRKLESGWFEIDTPHLDRHNDYLQIYLQKQGDDYVLTDDGYTLDDLASSGCDVSAGRRQELLTLTLNGFGVKTDGNALYVHANERNFPVKKHNLIQAMLAVDDLFYLSAPNVTHVFAEDVRLQLDEADVRYSRRIKLSGKSGFDHVFDFLIPKSKTHPERLIQTMNAPQKGQIESVVFKWLDTKETRDRGALAYVILNDTKGEISPPHLEALHNYDLKPIMFSKLHAHMEELAA